MAYTHKRSKSDSLIDLPLMCQNLERVEKECDFYPVLISANDWACTGGNGECKICNTGLPQRSLSIGSSPPASGGRKATQNEVQKMQRAIKNGDTNAIESMIIHDNIDVNATLLPIPPFYYVPPWGFTYFLGYTPLHCAVEEGNLSSVQKLVQLGADIMATSTKVINGKITTLEIAVDKNLVDIVHFFATEGGLNLSQFHDTYKIEINAIVDQYKALHASTKANTRSLVISHHILGKGKWGYIREAEFKEQRVAAKFFEKSNMSPTDQENLIREINISAQCNHKNLVSFLGIVLNEPTILVFELMDCNLRSALCKGELTVLHVHKICLDVAKGLFYLHNLQPNALIHCSIHSSNVLLKKEDNSNLIAKLSDLSLAKFAATVAKRPSLSKHTAPEISKRNSNRLLTTKIDIYAYGALFGEALVNLDGISRSAKPVSEILTTLQPHWPHHVPFLALCTSENPDARPGISEVITAVSKLARL